MSSRRRGAASSGTTLLVAAAVAVLLALVWWSGRGDDAGAGSGAAVSPTSATSTAPGGSEPTRAPPPARDESGLPVVRAADLPEEARETLALIAAGGPFPYDRDGAVFQNRERLLPRHPSGWYREYTVPTPGEDDRGARRIVTGRDGTAYWTDDHYDSFSVIEEEP